MADDVKTGIRLVAEGEDEFSKSLDNAAKSVDNFSSSAETAQEKTAALQAALDQAAQDQSVKDLYEELGTASAQLAEGLAKQAEGVFKIADAFFDAAEDAANYGDSIDKNSQKLGISARAYQEWNYVLGQNGAKISSLTGAMDQIRKVQTGYAKEAEDNLDAIGLSLEQIEAMSKEDAFAAIIQGLQGMADSSERASIARGLLGASYKELGPLLNTSAEDTQALIKRFYDLGGYMSDEAVKASAAYGDSVDDVNLKWESFKRNTIADFLPALTELREAVIQSDSLDKLAATAGTLADKLVSLAEFSAEHGDELIGTIEGIGAAWGAWKGAGIVKELVGNVQQLYSWLGMLGGVLGVGAGTAAAGIGLVGLSVATVADHAKSLQEAGFLGDGHELQEYADNVAYWGQQIVQLQQDLDNLAQYGGDLTMAQDALDFAIAAHSHAQEEYAAMEQAATQAAEAPQALAETAAAGAQVVTETAGAMLETITESGGAIRDDFAAGLDGMAEAASDEMIAANDAMAANAEILSSNANVWGTDMMISMANGIRAGANDWLLPSIDEVAAAMAARLHHSEPDVGPLADDNDWMPDMMRTFAQGITDYAPLVQDAIGQAFRLDDYITPPGAAMGTSISYGGINVTFEVQEGQDGQALFEEFSDWLRNELVQEGAVFAQ